MEAVILKDGLTLIHERKSVRSYTGEPVDKEEIDKILRAAMSSEEFAILDCTCASENILLATEALGLGAVWTAVYPNKELMDFVRKELNIPQHVIPLNVIPVGHPTGEDRAQDKYDVKNIHWGEW